MDLYNYWLMEKVAEEEKQDGFAKRHEKKLIGAGVIGAGALGAGAVAAERRGASMLREALNVTDPFFSDKEYLKKTYGGVKGVFRRSGVGAVDLIDRSLELSSVIADKILRRK